MQNKPQLRIVLIYTLFAALWIWASDHLLEAFVRNADVLTAYMVLKGWFFVLVTAVMLYVLIDRGLRRLEEANQKLEQGLEQALRVMTAAMDVRHKETGDHSARVTRVALEFARLVGVPESELPRIRMGALLHDMGKLMVPDAILLKPGALEPAEMALVKQHPTTAMEMMSQIDFLKNSIDIPYAHHEHWDGSGYPRGLRGEDIPFAARLFSVVDIWDALLFSRVYKHAWSEQDVLGYLEKAAGTELDPHLVARFLEFYPQLRSTGLQGHSTSGGPQDDAKGGWTGEAIPGHLTAGLVTQFEGPEGVD